MERETAQRIWAAGAYAGLTPPKLAKELGVSVDTLRRRVTNGFRALESEEGFVRQVAEVTGLPYGFFTEDFAVMDDVRRERPREEGPRTAEEAAHLEAFSEILAGALEVFQREFRERMNAAKPVTTDDDQPAEDDALPQTSPLTEDPPPTETSPAEQPSRRAS